MTTCARSCVWCTRTKRVVFLSQSAWRRKRQDKRLEIETLMRFEMLREETSLMGEKERERQSAQSQLHAAVQSDFLPTEF